jgi:hypothetical protein
MEEAMGLDQAQLVQDMCTMSKATSYLSFGKLVKTWATGVNQMSDDKDYSIPAANETLRALGSLTRKQFQSMLDNANVKMTVPDKVTRFVFVQDDPSTVIVRVPRGKVVEKVQRVMLDGLAHTIPPRTRYPFPRFYTENFSGREAPPLVKSRLLDLHCQRIGEYTINTCG